MKKLLSLFTVTAMLSGMLLFQSCGEEKKDEEGSDKKQEESAPDNDDSAEQGEDVTTPSDDAEIESGDQESSIEPINSRYAYDQDWDIIKEAILNKDVAAVKDWTGENDVDVQLLIDMLHADPEMIDILKGLTYDDMETVEGADGAVELEMAISVTGVNDEGHEVGSGIFLYFEQGDPSLTLLRYLAAG